MNRRLQLGVVLCVVSHAVVANAAPTYVHPAKGPSLCSNEEQVLWSCQTKARKLASLCASQPVSATQGYIQYRYGTLAKTEMRFPATTAEGSQQQFRYARYTRPLVTMLGVWFENAGYSYELRYDEHGDSGPVERTQEIIITAPDTKETHIDCKGAGLMNLEDLVPEEKDQMP